MARSYIERDHDGHRNKRYAVLGDVAHVPAVSQADGDTEADVVVVGGGITGLTAAYLLAQGKRVILLERGRCAMADTGHTSAHVTMVTDVRLSELAKALGRTHAQAVWDAGLAAIARIDGIVREHDIDAGFAWVDGYLHVPLVDDTRAQPVDLEADATLACELGFDAEYMPSVPLMGRPGVRFADQVRIHPRRYLAGVAQAFVALGGRIHEQSEVDEFCDGPRLVKANGHAVASRREARSGDDHRPEWRQGRSVSGRGWNAHASLGDLHAHGLHGRLEHGRAHMGLPVPRVTLHTDG